MASDEGLQPAWLIEVKDFRVLNYPPGVRSTVYLPQTLEKKVNDTLEVLGDPEVCPPALQGRVQGDVFFLFHYEMPQVPYGSYFPSGYPLNQFEMFLTLLSRPGVKKSFMKTASDINADETVPWEALLHDTRDSGDGK